MTVRVMTVSRFGPSIFTAWLGKVHPVSATRIVRGIRSPILVTWRRLQGADQRASTVLVILPLAVFVVPALFGHAAIVGDNVIQNYPLRVLVGSQIRHGHAPLLDPYIWSGAPLLGGWNAGAAYPLTLFFVFLPGTAAWTLNLVVTWWVAGIGSYVFLRASRLASVPSFLGALSFCFAGSMIAQQVHFGLVAGVSWIPLALLALLRLSELAARTTTSFESIRQRRRSALGWTALLGTAGAMTVLAGEPRAITDAAAIVGMYAIWRVLRLGRRAGPYLAWVVGGLLLAAVLSAVQLLPGLAAVSTSQRAASSSALFTSGSLANRWLALMLVPDLLGGSGSFGPPPFLASYNLTEVTGYVGIMPLVASFALLGRLRWRRPLPEWIVWEVIAAVGIVLALGGNTPLWHLLIHIPLFGGQRLQSRNIVIADIGFAFLLAYWSDAWLAERSRQSARAAPPTPATAQGPAPAGARSPVPPSISESEQGAVIGGLARILGSVPALLAVAIVIVGIAWGAGFLQWLSVSLGAASEDGALRLWFVPFGVLGLGAAALVLWGHRLDARRRTEALVGFVVVDLLVFTLMAVVTVAPALESSSGGSSVTAAPTQEVASPGASVPAPPTTLPASSFVGSGRFAVYDPDDFNLNGLQVIGQPDSNVVSGVPSIQGYSAIVDGTYADAAITPEATGHGRDNLIPSAVGNGTLDQLETTALFAPRDYFLVDTQSDRATPVPTAGERNVAPGGRATWYLGDYLSVTNIVVPDADATTDATDGLRVGVLTSKGTTTWAPAANLDGPRSLEFSFARPVAAVALVAQAGRTAVGLGSPSITSEDGTEYIADGQLEAAVVPPRWAYRGQDGTFAVFADRGASPALSLRGSAGASVHPTAGPAFAPSAAEVSSPHGVEVIRSEAAIPGWSASWQPIVGPAEKLAVHRVGLVQGVEVPAGQGTVAWTYDPPGWTAGWVLSVGALVALLAMLLWALALGRRRV